jgi:hypothetical protein
MKINDEVGTEFNDEVGEMSLEVETEFRSQAEGGCALFRLLTSDFRFLSPAFSSSFRVPASSFLKGAYG